MKMAGDLAVGRAEARLVAKDQGAVVDFLGDLAPAGGRRCGVMVPGNPNEARARSQAPDLGALLLRQTFDGLAVMEGIAQADDGVGLKHVDQGGKHCQGLARVVTRQQLAGRHGVGRTFLQMQVGHRQQAPGGPVQRTCRQRLQPLARALEVERAHGWITTRTPAGTSDQTSRISASLTATQPVVQSFAGWPTRNLRQPLG